jgi:hypothetical protein
MRERSGHLPIALELGACAYEHVGRKINATQTADSSLHSLDWALIGLRDNDEKIDVAVFGRSTPCVGAKKINGIRFELANEPVYGVGNLSRKIFGHGRNLAGVIGQIEYNFCTGQMGKG